jgi:hypothetical protein
MTVRPTLVLSAQPFDRASARLAVPRVALAISAYDVSISVARSNGNQRFGSACLPIGGDNAQ